ncbi:AraC family transcriptional regulator [Pseudomonas sp. B21-051]|uniref:helix-turn-helix domain-containing protein n=1 Tax=Pseudomonas sp. B21-051 TaxID=2895491 RepID=UPI0021605993|nr:AraC family transcriptional regulator [Pseudomonas sp. B21-051]UVK90129.1 AraC family transcriptional regulator [Pseudomonas sp. B21-051]
MKGVESTALSNVVLLPTGKLKLWQETAAKQLMLESLETGVSVSTLADACALSRSHFSRKFKASTRLSPTQWLRQQRVLKSKQLLDSSIMTLTQIAMACGFCDQAHFCRVFSKTEGMTPLAWKRVARAAA